MDNTYGLEKIQRNLFATLETFDELCRQNGIKYSLHGGTLLGAERNGKMIPWDDDVDISMSRNEFEKFKIASRSIEPYFLLEEGEMWVPRFVKKGDEPAWIDIFIWDYISEKRIFQLFKINILRGIQGAMKQDNDYSRFGFRDRFLLRATSLVGKMIPINSKKRLYKNVSTKMFLGKKRFIHRSNDSFRGISYIHDREYMDDYIQKELEGKMFYVNRRYKEFLTIEYGEDYLTPPPIEKRIPEHSNIRKSLNMKG